VAVIEGAPGTGKSLMLGTAARLAASSGMRVLSARGLEIERTVSFAVAVNLLEPALDGLPQAARARVFRDGAAVAAPLFGAGASAPEADHPRLGRALSRALRQLMRELTEDPPYRPFRVVIDDLHWCDLATLGFLAQLATGLDPLPLAIVLAIRSESAKPVRQALTAVLRAAPVSRVLRLRALSPAGVECLVLRSFLDAEPAFIEAIRVLSGGNPSYVRDLIDEAVMLGLAPTADAVTSVAGLLPESVVRSVSSRVTALPAPAADLAAAVAVLGDGVPLRRAAVLAGARLESAAQAADELAAAGVLRPGEPLAFGCPLYRAAVYAELPALARSRAHRTAARLLDAEGAAADDVAAHLLRTGPRGNERTVQMLRLAAADATARGAHATARLLLLRALEEPPPRLAWSAVVQELALADARTGAPEAVERVREALGGAEPPHRIDLLRALARLLAVRSEFAAAADTAGRALEEICASTGGMTAGLAEEKARVTEVAVEALAIAGFAGVAPSPAAAALRDSIMAEAVAGTLPSDPACLAYLAGVLLFSGAPAGAFAAAARAALDRMPADDGFYGILTGPAAMALISIDEYEPVQIHANAMLGAARAAGVVITEGMASHWLSLTRYRQGRLTEAVEAGKRVLAVADAGWDVCAGLTLPILAHAFLELGDGAAAARALSPRRFGSQEPSGWAIRAARAQLSLATGSPQVALTELLQVGKEAERGGLEVMLVEPWRSVAAQAALAVGDMPVARSLAAAEVEAARAAGTPRRLGTALRVAGLIDGSGASGLTLAREAVAVLAQSPARLELARALIDLGALLRRRGELSASRDPLYRGFELARELAAGPLAERARHELRAAGGRQRRSRARVGPEALTPTERSIATLAAGGLSTARIAAKLSVSAKTIDWHLGNAYRKLGITSRRDLDSALGDEGMAADAG
jgi:DNA-binding CsgD family transcriptional regulator